MTRFVVTNKDFSRCSLLNPMRPSCELIAFEAKTDETQGKYDIVNCNVSVMFSCDVPRLMTDSLAVC